MHDYTVRRSRISGLGLFTNSLIGKGSFVIEYTGERITRAEADRRSSKYLFQVSARRIIDGKGRRNISRYINHSCAPNCEPRIIGKKIYIYAIKNIFPGTEITYNYGKEYFDAYIKPNGCKCSRCIKKSLNNVTSRVHRS